MLCHSSSSFVQLIDSYIFRGAPGSSAAGFGSDAGAAKTVLADAIEENFCDGQEP